MHTTKTNMTMHTMPLSACAPGACVVIVDVAEGPDAKRIKALGLCSGHVIHIARAGNPMIVDVVSARVALAPSLASTISVTPCPDACHV